jgi:hypothetical protein
MTTDASVWAMVAAFSSTACIAALCATMRLQRRPASPSGCLRQMRHSRPPLSKGVSQVPDVTGTGKA